MPIGSSSGEYFADEGALLVDQAKKQQAITIKPVQEPSPTTSTMPGGSPTEPAGEFKSSEGTNVPENQYETKLSPEEETKFQSWKQQNAPNDTGEDYDLRGAYKARLEKDIASGHWPDTYKKPNHPTFSDESIYAKDRPDLAGSWAGPNHDQYVPPRDSSQDIKVNPWITITPEDIEKGINIGLSAGPGTMAGVKSAAMGSKLTDLGHAQVLEAGGVDPHEIWDETGFVRGVEGKWRHEIDDSKAVLNRSWLKLTAETTDKLTTGKLSNVLDHPELYKHYPELKDVKVIHDPRYPAGGAEWSPWAKTITMSTEAASNPGTLMHEVQHAIQDIEGFAKGGMPGKAGRDYELKYTKAVEDLIPESEDLIKKINTKGLNEEEYARSKYLTTVFKKYQEYKTAGNFQAAAYYLRLAGET